MAQAVSHQPLTAEAQVHARVSLCWICGGQSSTGTGFSPSSSVSPVNIIPPCSPFSYIIWGVNNRPDVGHRSET
jgi:hypothetical protein